MLFRSFVCVFVCVCVCLCVCLFVCLNPVSKREFVRIFPSVYEGKHIEHPQVEIIRAKEITIETAAICYADGERIGPMPAHITVSEGALKTWRN